MDELLPEIKDVILNLHYQIELRNFNAQILKFDDIIFLFETYYNKNMIRNLIYNNIRKVIMYNMSKIDRNRLDDLKYILHLDIDYDSMREIINDNEDKILNHYSIETIDDCINYLKDNNIDIISVDKSIMKDLVNFIISLVIKEEIGLAIVVLITSTQMNYESKGHKIQHYLLKSSLTTYIVDYLRTIINFIGKNEFIEYIQNIIQLKRFKFDYHNLFYNLACLENYDILKELVKVFKNMIYDCEEFNHSCLTSFVLDNLYKAIDTKSKDSILKFLDELSDCINI